MSRLEQKQEARVTQHNLQSHDTRAALAKFCDLFRVCGGPYGKNQVIRGSSGGHVTLTGSCGRLLAGLSLTRPELKLISSCVQAHLQRCGDAGLFMTYLCSRLVLLGSDLDMKSHTLNRLIQMFVRFILDEINDESKGLTVPVGLDRLDVLLAYLRSMLSSKTLLNLSECVCDQLSQLVLKAFLESVPDVDSGRNTSWTSDRIYCMTVENRQFCDSYVEQGVLLQFPEHYHIDMTCPLDIRTTQLDQASSERLNVPAGVEVIKVAVVSCSMAGDVGEMLDVHYEVSASQEQQVEQLVEGRMLALCGGLLQRGVGLLLCQKVIHPKVKAFLRSKGIVYVDRLGSAAMPYVQDITGAMPLSSVVTWDDLDSFLGCVTSVTPKQEKGQAHLLLQRDLSPLVTLVMCAPTEEKLAEFKACVSGCFKGLGHVITDRKLLVGGGCWQVMAAHRLTARVSENLQQMSNTVSCTELDVLKAAAVFRTCLLGWALALKEDGMNLLTDPASGHIWRVYAGREEEGGQDGDTHSEGEVLTCACGMKATSSHSLGSMHHMSAFQASSLTPVTPVTPNPSEVRPGLTWDTGPPLPRGAVLDSYTSCVSALSQACAAAATLLSVGHFIVDAN